MLDVKRNMRACNTQFQKWEKQKADEVCLWIFHFRSSIHALKYLWNVLYYWDDWFRLWHIPIWLMVFGCMHLCAIECLVGVCFELICCWYFSLFLSIPLFCVTWKFQFFKCMLDRIGFWSGNPEKSHWNPGDRSMSNRHRSLKCHIIRMENDNFQINYAIERGWRRSCKYTNYKQQPHRQTIVQGKFQANVLITYK